MKHTYHTCKKCTDTFRSKTPRSICDQCGSEAAEGMARIREQQGHADDADIEGDE